MWRRDKCSRCDNGTHFTDGTNVTDGTNGTNFRFRELDWESDRPTDRPRDREADRQVNKQGNNALPVYKTCHRCGRCESSGAWCPSAWGCAPANSANININSQHTVRVQTIRSFIHCITLISRKTANININSQYTFRVRSFCVLIQYITVPANCQRLSKSAPIRTRLIHCT